MAAEVKNYFKEMWNLFCNWKTVTIIWVLVLILGMRYISLYHIDFTIVEGRPWYYIQFKDVPDWLQVAFNKVKMTIDLYAEHIVYGWNWLTDTVKNMLK